MKKEVGERIQNIRHAALPFCLFYPPEWHKLKIAFSSSALLPIKIWLLLIPFVAGFVSVFPIEILAKDLEINIGNEFTPPFNFLLSYIAAVLYMVSYAIFWICCPDFIQRHDPKFDILPETTTRTEIIENIRKTVTSCFPNKITLESGRTFVRRNRGHYQNIDNSDDFLQKIDRFDAQEFERIWKQKANYTARILLKENGRRISVQTNYDGAEVLFDKTGLGEEIHPSEKIQVDRHLFDLIFFPSLRVLVNKDDRNLIASLAYTALYITLSESRSVARLATFSLLFLSAFIGFVLVTQIIYRGFELFLGL